MSKVLSGTKYNPFQQNKLTKETNTIVTFIDTVFKGLPNLIGTGDKWFYTFWNERLITAAIPLSKPARQNSHLIPRKFEDQKAEKKTTIICSNDIINKLRPLAGARKQKALRLFETELLRF